MNIWWILGRGPPLPNSHPGTVEEEAPTGVLQRCSAKHKHIRGCEQHTWLCPLQLWANYTLVLNPPSNPGRACITFHSSEVEREPAPAVFPRQLLPPKRDIPLQLTTRLLSSIPVFLSLKSRRQKPFEPVDRDGKCWCMCAETQSGLRQCLLPPMCYKPRFLKVCGLTSAIFLDET